MPTVVKELIVVKVMELSPSKIKDFPYRKVLFKSTDPLDNASYTLNINHYPDRVRNWSNWESICILGNVIQVTMQERNPKNVDQFKVPVVIRNVKNSTKEITKENLTQSVLDIEFEKISKYTIAIQQSVNIINEELNKG